MDYQVVFDVTKTSPKWEGLIGGAVMVGLGLLLWFYRHKPFSGWLLTSRIAGGLRTAFAGFFLGFNLLWFTWVAWATVGAHRAAIAALRDGTAMVVEGQVQEFDPMPFEGHKVESFSVAGVRFQYSDYMETAGFHQSRSHGGPIRQDLRVRIHYSGNEPYRHILKLEVAAQ